MPSPPELDPRDDLLEELDQSLDFLRFLPLPIFFVSLRGFRLSFILFFFSFQCSFR